MYISSSKPCWIKPEAIPRWLCRGSRKMPRRWLSCQTMRRSPERLGKFPEAPAAEKLRTSLQVGLQGKNWSGWRYTSLRWGLGISSDFYSHPTSLMFASRRNSLNFVANCVTVASQEEVDGRHPWEVPLSWDFFIYLDLASKFGSMNSWFFAV